MSKTVEDIIGRIKAADDFRVILMFETFLVETAALGYDPDKVVVGFPGDVMGVSADEVRNWIENDVIAETPTNRAVSAEFARTILTVAAQFPTFSAAVARAVLHPADEKLKAGVSLKIGAMATALMLVASTSFEVDAGPVKIKKEALTTEMIVALSGLVTSMRGEIPRAAQR